MALKIKTGKKYWIWPIQCWGTVTKIRKDDAGVPIVDLNLDGKDTFMAREHELSKSEKTLDNYYS